MKNKLFSFVPNKFFYLALISVLLFSACKKNDVVTTSPTSGLMAFNLLPDSTPPVVFVLDNNSLTNMPLSFNNYTGTYLNIFSGQRTLGLFQAGTDSSLASANYTFEPKKYYSAFAVGANGTYKTMIVDDHLDSLPDSTGNAFVRYVNAIPDSSSQKVTISSNQSNDLTGNTSFGDVSGFTAITPGDITVNLSNDSTISATKTIALEKDKIYTLLLTGMAHATDTAKAVKIKYIVNGTLTK